MDWTELLLPLIQQALDVVFKLVIIPAIVLGVKWLSEFIRHRIIRRIIEDAVLYAQQLYDEEGGAKKLDEAIMYVQRHLATWNINLTEQQIIDLIEPVLKELKNAIGEAW